MEQQYQPITMDNLAKVLEFNGYSNENKDMWDYYYYLEYGKPLRWDKRTNHLYYNINQINQCYRKEDLDLCLISLERQGIKLNHLPIEPKFDMKEYLLDSMLFFESELGDYILKYFYLLKSDAFISINVIENTKENADRLIQMIRIAMEVK